MSGVLGVTLPVPALAFIALESDAPSNSTATLAVTLPVVGAAISTGNNGSVGIALPAAALALTAATAQVASVAVAMPASSVALAGTTGNSASIALQLPSLGVALSTANTVGMPLPVPQVALLGTAGIIGNVSAYLPTPQVVVAGNTQYAAQVSIGLPTFGVQIEGSVGSVGGIGIILRALALAMPGVTGSIGSAGIVLPVPAVALAGGEAGVGNVQITVPLLYVQLNAQATSLVPTGTQQGAIVYQTESHALSQYSNYPFNSFAQVNGVYLAASDLGLFAIGGDTDNGAIISAAARVGITDFGTSMLKRVDRAYVGYRANGNLVVRVFTDEVNIREYMLEASGAIGLHGNHTRIGRGLRARYWQFEIANQNGADFSLNMIELKPTRLGRRIGGSDA